MKNIYNIVGSMVIIQLYLLKMHLNIKDHKIKEQSRIYKLNVSLCTVKKAVNFKC